MMKGKMTLGQLKSKDTVSATEIFPMPSNEFAEQKENLKQNDKKIAREARARRFALMKELRNLLHTTYPDIFDYARPKPLAIGVHRDIKEAFPQFSQILIRNFLKRWVRDQRYLSELLNSTVRVTLTGAEGSNITNEERENTLKSLENMKNKEISIS